MDETARAGRCADLAGLKLYYESSGEGFPLVLLHGGLGAIEMSRLRTRPNCSRCLVAVEKILASTSESGRYQGSRSCRG